MKSKYETYRKILEKKAEEVQSSMSAQKAAQVLAREEHPHDEGDLSQQSHEEWIFLNRNTLDIKLLRLWRLLRVRRAHLRQAAGRRAMGQVLCVLPGAHRRQRRDGQ